MLDMEEYATCLDVIAECNHIQTEDPMDNEAADEGQEVDPENIIEDTEQAEDHQ